MFFLYLLYKKEHKMEKELLYKFFEGKASFEEKGAIRIWLESSSKNEQYLFKEREFFDAMILSGESLTPIKVRLKKSLSKFICEFLKIAAIIICIVGCGSYFYQWKLQQMGQKMNIVTVPAGQRVNLTLSDGTNVWVNACSEIRYPSVFTGEKRNVYLRGEAYFEVSRDVDDKLFIVQTDKFDIEVLGTKFNVEVYDDSDNFCTSLLEGSVKILDKNSPGKDLLLKPNYQVSLVDGCLRSKPITDFDSFRWKEGLICLKNITFRDLMQRLEQCYDVRIIVENQKLVNYTCSGKFRISDGVDRVLSVLQKDVNFLFERGKDDFTIYIR